jgi:hypothetical protein
MTWIVAQRIRLAALHIRMIVVVIEAAVMGVPIMCRREKEFGTSTRTALVSTLRLANTWETNAQYFATNGNALIPLMQVVTVTRNTKPTRVPSVTLILATARNGTG